MEPTQFMEIIQEMIQHTDQLKGEHIKTDLEEEREDLKLYSERLVNKLEKKMFQLEAEIVERKQIEEDLRQSQKDLRTLSARLQEVEEAERKRLSRELHDQVGTVLRSPVDCRFAPARQQAAQYTSLQYVGGYVSGHLHDQAFVILRVLA